MPLQSNPHVQHRDAYHNNDAVAVAQMLKDADWNDIDLEELADEFDRSRHEMQRLLNSMQRYVSYYRRADGSYIVTSRPALRDLPRSELNHVAPTDSSPAV